MSSETQGVGNDISVVIPAHNAGSSLEACLEAVARLAPPAREVILVDDASTDGPLASAGVRGARIVRTSGRCGPAQARNLGAQAATGAILFFLDSDVCVHADATARIAAVFCDATVDAVIGSYDDEPACQDFLSQYKNLMHHFVHQNANREASTFWAGCGAIRRQVFLQLMGFDASFVRPAVEDIEFGYRLRKDSRRIRLDPLLRAQHLKKWTFWNLIKTDVLDRGIPWTELILREQNLPNDLNVQVSQRASIILVYVMLASAVAVALHSGLRLLIPWFAILYILLNHYWADGVARRLRSTGATMLGAATVIALLAWFFHLRALVPLLAGSALELVLGRRLSAGVHRWLAWLFILAVLLVSAKYQTEARWLALSLAGCACLIALLNRRFFLFLGRKRGGLFAVAAFPFHLLYHFYNGASFLVGACRWALRTWTGARHRPHPRRPLDV